jgi:hypothetical protein
MRKILKQVTVTGADDSVDLQELIEISKKFPFVEFGILCSKNNSGTPRFPSQKWIDRLYSRINPNLFIVPDINLSMHLCGSWVRSLCYGDNAIYKDWISQYIWRFDRIQLNFHQIDHRSNDVKSVSVLKTLQKPIIYQMDNVNDSLFMRASKLGLDCYPFYDISGGRGIIPDEWPKPLTNYCGYAGGLSPDNLKENLNKLSEIVGDTPIWIDAETHLRSKNDIQFDLDKVMKFLEIAKPYAI